MKISRRPKHPAESVKTLPARIVLLLIIPGLLLLTAGCVSSPEDVRNTTTTIPSPPATTERIVTNPPGAPTPYQPAFATGDIITDDPSDLCTGYYVLRHHLPTESYDLREVGRRATAENVTWEWKAPPVRMSYAEIDNGDYVVIEHVGDSGTIVGPVWTLT